MTPEKAKQDLKKNAMICAHNASQYQRLFKQHAIKEFMTAGVLFLAGLPTLPIGFIFWFFAGLALAEGLDSLHKAREGFEDYMALREKALGYKDNIEKAEREGLI